MANDVNKQVEKEALFGIAPVMKKEKLYGFLDAVLVLSGYCIATWSYTQGSYLTTLVGFKQLLIGAFLGAILMLAIYQLPVILSVRYGIDIWIWLKAVFGHRGTAIMTVVIIIINYPWYAVCADLFASSMGNLAALFGVTLPDFMPLVLRLLCVAIGTAIAYKGIGAITHTTRILVPLLLAALLFVDFFFVRKQKLALRSAFELKGYNAYNYTHGINWIGMLCVAAGVAMSLLVYNPVTGEVHNMLLFRLTPTGFSFLGTGLLYLVLSYIPPVRKYLLRDRGEITV